MIKIYLHLYSKGEDHGDAGYYEFQIVPSQGEYITDNEKLYKVEMVIHAPGNDSAAAEIFAVKVDLEEELSENIS